MTSWWPRVQIGCLLLDNSRGVCTRVVNGDTYSCKWLYYRNLHSSFIMAAGQPLFSNMLLVTPPPPTPEKEAKDLPLLCEKGPARSNTAIKGTWVWGTPGVSIFTCWRSAFQNSTVATEALYNLKRFGDIVPLNVFFKKSRRHSSKSVGKCATDFLYRREYIEKTTFASSPVTK
jgi:hypothetical protein